MQIIEYNTFYYRGARRCLSCCRCAAKQTIEKQYPQINLDAKAVGATAFFISFVILIYSTLFI